MVASSQSKHDRALAAAEAVFARYGYARATMSDFARAAGMSRPALYLLFPGKEEAFAEVIRAMDDRKHAEIAADIAASDTLDRKLLSACVRWGLHGVALAQEHPDAADLFDLRFPAVQGVYARFELLVAGLIADAVAASDIDATPAELARALVHGMRGLRATAADVEDMRRLITVQVLTLLRAITPARQSA